MKELKLFDYPVRVNDEVKEEPKEPDTKPVDETTPEPEEKQPEPEEVSEEE